MADPITRSIVCDGGMPAYIAVPGNLSGPTAAIVVRHERYGFVQHTKDLADRMAKDGFVAIAPDCFFRHPDQDALHAGDARYDISDDEAAEHLTTAVEVRSYSPINGDSSADVVSQTPGRHSASAAASCCS